MFRSFVAIVMQILVAGHALASEVTPETSTPVRYSVDAPCALWASKVHYLDQNMDAYDAKHLSSLFACTAEVNQTIRLSGFRRFLNYIGQKAPLPYQLVTSHLEITQPHQCQFTGKLDEAAILKSFTDNVIPRESILKAIKQLIYSVLAELIIMEQMGSPPCDSNTESKSTSDDLSRVLETLITTDESNLTQVWRSISTKIDGADAKDLPILQFRIWRDIEVADSIDPISEHASWRDCIQRFAIRRAAIISDLSNTASTNALHRSLTGFLERMTQKPNLASYNETPAVVPLAAPKHSIERKETQQSHPVVMKEPSALDKRKARMRAQLEASRKQQAPTVVKKTEVETTVSPKKTKHKANSPPVTEQPPAPSVNTTPQREQIPPRPDLPAKSQPVVALKPLIDLSKMASIAQMRPNHMAVLLAVVPDELDLDQKAEAVAVGAFQHARDLRFFKRNLFQATLRHIDAVADFPESQPPYQRDTTAYNLRIYSDLDRDLISQGKTVLTSFSFNETSKSADAIALCWTHKDGLERMIRARDCAYADKFFLEALFSLLDHVNWKSIRLDDQSKDTKSTDEAFVKAYGKFKFMLFPILKARLAAADRLACADRIEQTLIAPATYVLECEGMELCMDDSEKAVRNMALVNQYKHVITQAMSQMVSFGFPVILDPKLERRRCVLQDEAAGTEIILTPAQINALKMVVGREIITNGIQTRAQYDKVIAWYEEQHQRDQAQIKDSHELVSKTIALNDELQRTGEQLMQKLDETKMENAKALETLEFHAKQMPTLLSAQESRIRLKADAQNVKSLEKITELTDRLIEAKRQNVDLLQELSAERTAGEKQRLVVSELQQQHRVDTMRLTEANRSLDDLVEDNGRLKDKNSKIKAQQAEQEKSLAAVNVKLQEAERKLQEAQNQLVAAQQAVLILRGENQAGASVLAAYMQSNIHLTNQVMTLQQQNALLDQQVTGMINPTYSFVDGGGTTRFMSMQQILSAMKEAIASDPGEDYGKADGVREKSSDNTAGNSNN